ncbi:immunoglobulin lambda-1 light chain-like protein [Lates japonicus]|nr:immunoglobulin lambda-1 light chain-like protein [Lates japonicus]
MILLFLIITYTFIPVAGSSLSDQVQQTPADIQKKPGGTATIKCSHSIDSSDRILCSCQDVTFFYPVSWNCVSQICRNCSHNKMGANPDAAGSDPGVQETMTPIVYHTAFYGAARLWGLPQAIFSQQKIQ